MADHARQWAHWSCHQTLRMGPGRDNRHGAVLPNGTANRASISTSLPRGPSPQRSCNSQSSSW
eukprot:11225623-Lingulodinium_polyedra.AAC.1